MDRHDIIIVNDKKEFQEARTKPPKVAYGGSGDSAAFLCFLCSWLLNIPYQSYCGDKACYKLVPEATSTVAEAEVYKPLHDILQIIVRCQNDVTVAVYNFGLELTDRTGPIHLIGACAVD